MSGTVLVLVIRNYEVLYHTTLTISLEQVILPRNFVVPFGACCFDFQRNPPPK